MTHTLIVTYDPVSADLVGELDPHDTELLHVELECSEVTADCRTWWECTQCRDRLAGCDQWWHDAITETIYADEWLHGVEHKFIDLLPMTPGRECISHTLDGVWDRALDAAAGLAPGRWTIDLDYEGDGETGVSVVAPVAFITEHTERRAAYHARTQARLAAAATQ